jgi:hypothetical protein
MPFQGPKPRHGSPGNAQGHPRENRPIAGQPSGEVLRDMLFVRGLKHRSARLWTGSRAGSGGGTSLRFATGEFTVMLTAEVP